MYTCTWHVSLVTLSKASWQSYECTCIRRLVILHQHTKCIVHGIVIPDILIFSKESRQSVSLEMLGLMYRLNERDLEWENVIPSEWGQAFNLWLFQSYAYSCLLFRSQIWRQKFVDLSLIWMEVFGKQISKWVVTAVAQDQVCKAISSRCICNWDSNSSSVSKHWEFSFSGHCVHVLVLWLYTTCNNFWYHTCTHTHTTPLCSGWCSLSLTLPLLVVSRLTPQIVPCPLLSAPSQQPVPTDPVQSL